MLFLIYFYPIMYQIMDKCVFFVATFIHSFILYRDFFSMKWAGLHPSVFFFIITIVFHLVSLILLSNLLTKWQKAELSYFTTRHSTPLPQNLFFPITFPAMTKRGPPAVQIPFSYLRTSMLVLKRYMKLDMCTEQSLDPDPTIPPVSFGHVFCVQTSLWT